MIAFQLSGITPAVANVIYRFINNWLDPVKAQRDELLQTVAASLSDTKTNDSVRHEFNAALEQYKSLLQRIAKVVSSTDKAAHEQNTLETLRLTRELAALRKQMADLTEQSVQENESDLREKVLTADLRAVGQMGEAKRRAITASRRSGRAPQARAQTAQLAVIRNERGARRARLATGAGRGERAGATHASTPSPRHAHDDRRHTLLSTAHTAPAKARGAPPAPTRQIARDACARRLTETRERAEAAPQKTVTHVCIKNPRKRSIHSFFALSSHMQPSLRRGGRAGCACRAPRPPCAPPSTGPRCASRRARRAAGSRSHYC